MEGDDPEDSETIESSSTLSSETGNRPKGQVRYGLPNLRTAIASIDDHLSEGVEAYLIGGCAMAYAGLKAATKDIDVVVEIETGFDVLREALSDAHYDRIDPEGPYEQLDAAGYFDKDHAPRWDIYVRTVCNALQLSPGMVERADRIEEGLERLRIFRVHPADIFIFKSITDRPADRDDMDAIFAAGLDWDTVLDEMRWQSTNSERAWTGVFAQSMREFSEAGRDVPILEELEEIAEREVGQTVILERVRSGVSGRADLIEEIDEDPAWVEELIDDLVESGRLRSVDGALVAD